MKIEIYVGCWGVTRVHEVVGPLKKLDRPDEFPWYAEGQRVGVKRWRTNGTYNLFLDPVSLDVIHVFPSRESAEAWVNRKPWWKRSIWQRSHFWKGFLDWRPWAFGAFLGLLIVALTSCTSPTSPVHSTEPKCKTEEWNGTAWVWVEVPCDSVEGGK